jgi:hypothetical protein
VHSLSKRAFSVEFNCSILLEAMDLPADDSMIPSVALKDGLLSIAGLIREQFWYCRTTKNTANNVAD